MAVVQIRTLLDEYHRRCGVYPATSPGIGVLVGLDAKPSCTTLEEPLNKHRGWITDGWGVPLRYVSDGSSFRLEASHDLVVTDHSKTANELSSELTERHQSSIFKNLVLEWKWTSLGGEVFARRLKAIYLAWPILAAFFVGFVVSITRYRETFGRYGVHLWILLPMSSVSGLLFFGSGIMSMDQMYWPWWAFAAMTIESWLVAAVPVVFWVFARARHMERSDLRLSLQLFFITHGLMALACLLNPFALIE